MSRMPGATWRPILVNYTRAGQQSVRGVVVHIMAGSLAGTDSWFRNSRAQASAHFGTGKGGELYQWVDTADRAWAQAGGNRDWLSIENEGRGGDALTEAQLDRCAQILAWAHRLYGVPLQVTHNPSGRGLGYHAMGGAAWGGHTSCPGDRIVAQLDDIVARARHAAANPTASTDHQEDDDMPQYVSLTRPEPFELEPGHEDAVEFTREYADHRGDHAKGGSQFIHGPALYQGTAYLELTGVEEGAEIQVRVSEVDRDDGDYVGNGGCGEYTGTAGTTFIAYPFTDTTPKGEGVRLRLKHFSSKPVTVRHVTLKALVWPR